MEADRLDRRPEPFGRPLDERAVERAGDLELDRSSCAERLCLGAELLDGCVLAGDDDLTGAVVVRRPDALDLARTVPRRPRPRGRGSRPSSPDAGEPPPPSRGLARARSRSPRPFPSPRPTRALRTPRPSGRRRRPARALRLGSRPGWRGTSRSGPAVAPRSRRAPRAACRSRASGGRAPTPRCRRGRRPSRPARPRRARGPCRPRAHPAPENRMRLCPSRSSSAFPTDDYRRQLSAVGPHWAVPPHSISAEPQVSPAPIPVINTSAPSVRRPSARASASASGIDPDDVFPNRSTFTTVRSGGMPSLPTA